MKIREGLEVYENPGKGRKGLEVYENAGKGGKGSWKCMKMQEKSEKGAGSV